MTNIVEQIEQEHIAELTKDKNIPDFQPGDTLKVHLKVTEGTRERIQVFEAVCIGRSGGGLQESFTMRKISYGEGLERVFPIYSPLIEKIEVVRRGDVRRAKLYYLRGRTGKSARIAEKQDWRRLNDKGAKGKNAKASVETGQDQSAAASETTDA